MLQTQYSQPTYICKQRILPLRMAVYARAWKPRFAQPIKALRLEGDISESWLQIANQLRGCGPNLWLQGGTLHDELVAAAILCGDNHTTQNTVFNSQLTGFKFGILRRMNTRKVLLTTDNVTFFCCTFWHLLRPDEAYLRGSLLATCQSCTSMLVFVYQQRNEPQKISRFPEIIW